VNLNSPRTPYWIGLVCFCGSLGPAFAALADHVDALAVAVVLLAVGGWFVVIGALHSLHVHDDANDNE
jgi:uncharacterized membrane protein